MSGIHAAPSRIQLVAATLRWSGVGRSIAQTAGFNVAATAAAGLGGIILARAVGPTVRGRVCGYYRVVRHCADGRRHGAASSAVLPCRTRPPARPRVCGDVAGHDAHYGHGRPCLRHAAGPCARTRRRRGVARLPDCVRRVDHGLRRGELHLFAAGARPAQVECGAGQPARAQLDRHWRAVAAQAAHPGQSPDRSGRDHAASARLGLRKLPAHRPGARPRACCIGSPARGVRCRADCGTYARRP